MVLQAFQSGSWTWRDVGKGFVGGSLAEEAFNDYHPKRSVYQKLINIGFLAYLIHSHAKDVCPQWIKPIKYAEVLFLVPYAFVACCYMPRSKDDEQSTGWKILKYIPQVFASTDFSLSFLRVQKHPVEAIVQLSTTVIGIFKEADIWTTAKADSSLCREITNLWYSMYNIPKIALFT